MSSCCLAVSLHHLPVESVCPNIKEKTIARINMLMNTVHLLARSVPETRLMLTDSRSLQQNCGITGVVSVISRFRSAAKSHDG